jgi:uncharacterized protein
MMTSQVVPMPNPQGGGLAPRSVRFAGTLPSILGLYTFAAATFVVGTRMAHWYGSAQSASVLFPLILFFGVAEFFAGAWAFRTGDRMAVAMHGTWGTFWTAFGILDLLYAMGTVSHPAFSSELGFWFIAIAAITWGLTAGARENKGIMSLLLLLAIGATLECIAELAGLESLRIIAGYFMFVSAIVAWCVATTQLVRSEKIEEKAQPAVPVAQNESMRAAS